VRKGDGAYPCRAQVDRVATATRECHSIQVPVSGSGVEAAIAYGDYKAAQQEPSQKATLERETLCQPASPMNPTPEIVSLRLPREQAELLAPLVLKAASGRQNVLFLATCAPTWDREAGAVTWR